MNQIKAHPKGNVPFSWEKKPGVSKAISQMFHSEADFVKLPPPPCLIENQSPARVSTHDIQIPLPPCTFQPPSRSSSRKGGLKKQEDPFLAAYKECTKSTSDSNKKTGGKLCRNVGLRKGMFSLSCKNSCSVRDDNLVRVSHQVPHEIDRQRSRER
ncbi:hypothetical protein MANES_05G183500v8 [Manihot esculenta]|uniref:Uncharacterized protein n=1 Tax=Manihot esculenta TaxID=3983 RepID=A0A2C9VZY0_MANES|nr:hypothetical protein MANES_05G183500v8 [Manihot esculenta]